MDDYKISIYTTIRKKPYAIRMKSNTYVPVREAIMYIKEHGIFLGQYEFDAIFLLPDTIMALRWIKCSKIMSRFYTGNYLDKEQFPGD